MSIRQFAKLTVLATIMLLPSGTTEADEPRLGSDVFRSEKVGRDIFSTKRSSLKQTAPLRQAEQSPPVRNAQPGPLIGEGSLTPELQKSLSGTRAADVLEQTRNIKQSVEKSLDQGSGSQYFERAISAVRASSDIAAGVQNEPAPAIQPAQSAPARGPIVQPRRAAPSGFARASLSPQPYSVMPPSTLSVIVDGADIKHTKDTLRRLANVAKNKNVKVGNVYLVGVKELGDLIQDTALQTRGVRRARSANAGEGQALAAARAIQSSFYKHIEDAGMGHYEVVPVQRVLDRWKVKYSPTWIVRHKGRDYVFEGFDNPDTFFNREGQFVREDG